MRNAAKKYELLLKLNNAIINQYTRETLFHSLAIEIGKLFPYDRFSINLYDQKTNTLSYFGTAGGINPPEISKKEIRPFQSREPVFIYDLSQSLHLETAKFMLEAGLTSTMAFPMIVHNTILGSIHFSFKKAPPDIFELREFLKDLSVQVAIAVDNLLSHEKLNDMAKNLEREKRYLLDSYQHQHGDFCYASRSIAGIMKEIQLIAKADASVLITGETGTGKDHIARHIHDLSPRRDNLFVKVNCAALTPTLIESELFGHAKGAYTGADTRRMGRFETAAGGSIFLDEIGELPLNIQAKLLQVLQDRTFERVGESTPVSVDFRVIAATNQDLKLKIQERSFRSDLYYRIGTIHIHIPPLRERIEDIPLLVNYFTTRHSARLCRPEVRYTPSAIEALCSYSWPGNVRQLENLIERQIILRAGQAMTTEDINNILSTFNVNVANDRILTRDEMEKEHIEKALIQCNGIVGGNNGAAKLLGMRRSTLQYRMKKLGIDPSLFPGKEVSVNSSVSNSTAL
jgi:transcriptional regulator with GAF, ATPase, and Fis domain